nr:MAG TPA: Sec-independent protein translocase protein (TatC) [Caudoviricetes sp.]
MQGYERIHLHIKEMKTRVAYSVIILVVAIVANWIYIDVVWGTFGAFLNDCLIRSLIGIVCLVVILVAISLTSKR